MTEERVEDYQRRLNTELEYVFFLTAQLAELNELRDTLLSRSAEGWDLGYERGYDDREKMDHDRADVICSVNPFRLDSDRTRQHSAGESVFSVDLWYPRNRAPRDTDQPVVVEIGLIDVRAADSIRIDYDFDRDGYVIKQASVFSWEISDTVCDGDWQEVAFVQSWGREKSGQ